MDLISELNCFSVYDLTVPNMDLVAFFEAHESDIMCMEYSDPHSREFVLYFCSLDIFEVKQFFLLLLWSFSFIGYNENKLFKNKNEICKLSKRRKSIVSIFVSTLQMKNNAKICEFRC